MKHRSIYLALLPLLGVTALSHAEENLSPVVVTASKNEYRDIDAPYASEVYTAAQIAASGATTLYDFLGQQSSVSVMPSYGNSFAQKLDMRGYGIGDGYQNIVVTLDGHRLNNIDMSAQLLGAIPLASIERIEITKGSGSVAYGDGATAGAIHIYTRDRDGAHLTLAAGNHGATTSSLSAGLSEGRFALSVTAENSTRDGYSSKDINGQRDSADSDNLRLMTRLFASDATELRLGKNRSRIDTSYPGALTLAEFDADPAQNGGNAYTRQKYAADGTTFGVSHTLSPQHKLVFDHYQEQRASENISWSWNADYETRSNEIALHSTFGRLHLAGGLQGFKGTRTTTSNETSKQNGALYLQGDYRLDATTLSLGGRRERVRYEYQPNNGTALKAEEKLSAADIGINHRYDAALSTFANYDFAYQAPDIDRFFTWGGGFNGFISPARVHTLTVGINHTQENNKLKVALFRAAVHNEIYYNAATWTNTNIDRSHKYGLELQENHRFNQQWSGNLNYSWTRAVIDSEDMAGGAYDGNEMPGVSRHVVTLGASYTPTERSTVALSHNYRSSSYAAEDFSNSASQRQASYQSTNLRYGYRVKNSELFVKVDNLFNHANGLWITNDAIYPVNFTRNWLFGVKADF